MEITFFRSSSLNQWYYCQQSYFINYNLGVPQKTNAKTEKGTIVHKVLEVLAGMKLNHQNTGKYFFEDDSIGYVECSEAAWNEITVLSDENVDKLNKSMINKSTYIDQKRVPYGQARMGLRFINALIKVVYDYYVSKSEHEWGNIEWRDCYNFTWIALDWNDGDFDPRKRNIVCPEKPFNFIIQEDWAKIGENEYLGLKGTIDLTTKIDGDTIEIIDWKGLPIETPIPTPTGWSTMGNLVVGNEVFDKDGNICTVIGKSKKNIKPCYKITFDDKTDVICDNEHLWYLNDGKVVPVTELKLNDKIPVNKSLVLEDIPELPIDPYVLGAWLGDGRNSNGEISGIDEFIFEEIARRGYRIGDNINSSSDCPSKTIFGLITQLKKWKLINNKHIPECYFRASHNQRLALLQGLMDTDGNVNLIRKQAVFTNCNKRLSDDVKKLLITLGQRPNQANLVRDTNFKKNVKVFPIAFRPLDINPFLIPRKRNKIGNWGYGRSNIKIIKKIELIESKETQCISVDSRSNTYLCTENMIVTHNTGMRKDWGTGVIKDYDYLCSDKQLMLYYYAAKKVFPEYKNVIISIFFIRHGGPFTLCFDDSTEAEIKSVMAKTKAEIESCQVPKLLDPRHRDFRCERLCTYYKNKVDGIPYCDYIHNEIKLHGIDVTTIKHRKEGFTIGHYQNPGE